MVFCNSEYDSYEISVVCLVAENPVMLPCMKPSIQLGFIHDAYIMLTLQYTQKQNWMNTRQHGNMITK